MSSFTDKMKSRKKDLKKLQENTSAKRKSQFHDDRFWKLSVDDKQKGEALIRFLPGVEGEEEKCIVAYSTYYVRTKSSNEIFVAPAPENVGKPSFPNEVRSKIWKKFQTTNDLKYKELFKERSPSTKYVTNILVLKDPANPENEGKVFLFEMGEFLKRMYYKEMGIEESASAKEESKLDIEDEDAQAVKEPYDHTDLFEGANFILKSYSETGKALNRSYDKSYFSKRKPAAEDEAELERIYNAQYSLKEFTDAASDRYKESYEAMKNRYIKQTGDYFDIFPEEYQSRMAEQKAYQEKKDEEFEDGLPWEDSKDDGGEEEFKDASSTTNSTDVDDIDDFLNS